MSLKTRSQIQTEINNEIVTNNDRGITADILNTIFTDLNDSAYNKLTDNTNLGLYSFDVSKSYNLNQCVVYNNQIYKANQIINPGTFSSNQWNIVTNEKKCVLNVIGNTNNAPTIYVKYDNLFGVTPSVSRNAIGNYDFIFNNNVFSTTYSISFESWNDANYLPTFPVSISPSGNTMNVLVYNYFFNLVDIYKGYIIIKQYT